jgi:hypothetical protein
MAMAALLPPNRVQLLHQRWWFGPSGATAWKADDGLHPCAPELGALAGTAAEEHGSPAETAVSPGRILPGHGGSKTGRLNACAKGDGASAADMHAGDPTSRPASAVLLCGEGDFSFASALVSAHHHVQHDDDNDKAAAAADGTIAAATPLFVCTSLDSEAAVLSRYPAAIANIERIRSCGGVVLHEVDATKLTECVAVTDAIGLSDDDDVGHIAGRRADLLGGGRIVVIFQFPHHGGKGKIQVNRKLIRDYFSSAGALAKQADEQASQGTSLSSSAAWPSEVYVSLAPGQGGTDVDGKAQREWGNAWQVVCCAGDAGLVMRGAYRFDADAWTTLGYAPRGRHSRGLGEFHVDWAVTHVFAPENIGIVGVCCPVWRHDVGLWCSPRREREVHRDDDDGDDDFERGGTTAATPRTTAATSPSESDEEDPAPFDEAAFVRFVLDHAGADILANEPGVPCVALVRSEAQTELGLPSARTEFERVRERYTHRLTYRIAYKASGDRALSKARSTAAQLALRLAIQQSDLPVLLT